MNDFLHITSNDNWFKKHPNKIAGVEYKTTSMYFPIMVKGTKDDVYRVTKTSISKGISNISLAKAKAKMKMAKAKLLLK